MINSALIFFGKLLTKTIQMSNLGNGSTWPGHIALAVNKRFIKDLIKTSDSKIIFVVGTNGKTTTTSLIKHLLEKSGRTVIQNSAGANLLNGIASTLLLNASINGKITADFILFEIDENAFTLALKEIHPDFIVMLNLFRDQLDRYGEVATIAHKWKKAIDGVSPKSTLLLNADDPQVAYIGKNIKNRSLYFGITNGKSKETKNEHASDSTFCPECETRLMYKRISYSHLGNWECPQCNLKRPVPDVTMSPIYPLTGTYNAYNTHAAILLAKNVGLEEKELRDGLISFKPVFGRQEEISIYGKKAVIFLAKNPTGFNETLRTISRLNAKHVLLILNDRIADGKDVSWIWDIDIEDFIAEYKQVTISGERCYDMAMRIKYAQKNPSADYTVEHDLKKAIKKATDKTPATETLFILPTYTAMLQLREITTGKKLL